jgi:hypothetical protein
MHILGYILHGKFCRKDKKMEPIQETTVPVEVKKLAQIIKNPKHQAIKAWFKKAK